MPNHRIKDIEIELLLLALKERWGYDFTGYARASLKRRMESLIEHSGMDCLSRLLPSVLYDVEAAQTAIDAISVPTSDFFRDPPVWRYIRHTLAEQLNSFPLINIWQVGCGHGQETYSLAILLHEIGLHKKARIVTTDINNAFLNHSKIGCWPKRNLEAWTQNYQLSGGQGDFNAYFDLDDDFLYIKDEFKTTIEFVQHNLALDNAFLETQFIICRNVLIYFGENLQKRVFEVFQESLERGGFLLLGRAESRPEDLVTIQLEEYEQTLRFYRKAIRGHYV